MADRLVSFLLPTTRIIFSIACLALIALELKNLYGHVVDEEVCHRYDCPTSLVEHYFRILAKLVIGAVGLYGAVSKKTTVVCLFLFMLSMFMMWSMIFTLEGKKLNGSRNKARLERKLRETMKDYQFDLPPNEQPNEATKNWDMLQDNLSCCGLVGPSDWTDQPIFSIIQIFKNDQPTKPRALPKSCCPAYGFTDEDEKGPLCSFDYAYSDGCLKKTFEIIDAAASRAGFEVFSHLILMALSYALWKLQEMDKTTVTQRVMAISIVRPPSGHEAGESA